METTRDSKNLHRSILQQNHNSNVQDRKKVNFADDANLPLYYVLPEHEENEEDKEDKNEENEIEEKECNHLIESINRYFVSNFIEIDELDALRRFNSNKICIYSIDFTQIGKIKGRIYVKIEQPISSNPISNDDASQQNSNQFVYVIWSIDSWKTWQTQEAKLIEQGGNHRIFIFSIENICEQVKNGTTLELAACYQIDDQVYKDTNDSHFFKFQCYEQKETRL